MNLSLNAFGGVIRQYHKGRMLHYFAQSDDGDVKPSGTGDTDGAVADEDDRVDSWCGWHNDHSTLTGLVKAVYTDDRTGERVPNPNPEEVGLFISARDGTIVKPQAPKELPPQTN